MKYQNHWGVCALLIGVWWGGALSIQAGSLTGTTRNLQNSTVNLSTNGTLDWVHWGLYTESSLNRKAGVTPQISDFTLLDNTNGFVFGYQYSDNENGYTWTDGDPVAGVTNTTTGIWAYGVPFIGTGFQLTAPAGTASRTLKVYCGVFAGTGHFEASLSDGSAPDFTTSFNNPAMGGPSREVTLHYAADAPNQTLTVRWRLQLGAGPTPNVTLQAAALSAEGANTPPIVRLTSPTSDANYAAPGDVTLSATSSDLDGSVAMVEFFANGTKVGEDTTSPYSIVWNSPAIGRYVVTAVATDDGSEMTTSVPVAMTVYGAGGSLTGTALLPPTMVNLTTEGAADWQHWGASSSNLFNRKAGVAPLLGELDPVGSSDLHVYTDNYTAFSWSDGSPLEAATNLKHGVFLYGPGRGFELTAPADATPRQVRLYAGLYGAQGHFQAWLSDLSAPAFHNHSLSNVFGNDYGIFTLDYSAASAGQTLNIRYVAEKLFDSDFGNVTIQAATLQGGGPTARPVQIVNPTFDGAGLRFSFQTQSSSTYLAQWREFLGGSDWQTFATVPGTGGLITVTNDSPTANQRYYRVETR
jgi:hypothetical protein